MKAIMVSIFLLLGISYASLGQGCSVCSKTAAGMDDNSAKGLNAGVLYIIFIPFAILGAIGYVWWKSNRSLNQ